METWCFTASDDALFRHFAEQGFAVIENVLDAVAVQQLLAALEEAAGLKAAHARGAGAHAMRNVLQSVPAVRELAASPALRALVETVLGAGAIPVNGLLFDKTPDANWK